MHSKLSIKPERKAQVCTENAIFCTRSRLTIVFSNIDFEKRLWLGHVCKVCARLALLLRFYRGSCSEAVFGTLGTLGVIFVTFLGFLSLWALLGVSWGSSGPLLRPSGPSWGHLGPSGAIWVLLGSAGAFWGLLGSPGRCWGSLCGHIKIPILARIL